MTTTFQERLQNLHVDEGLLALIASQVPRKGKPAQGREEEIGLQLLRFLETKPDCAQEAASAAHLPRDVRETIARRLAQEFAGEAPVLSLRMSAPAEEGGPQAPGLAEVPGRGRSRSPYRVVFGCRYEPSASSTADKTTTKGDE